MLVIQGLALRDRLRPRCRLLSQGRSQSRRGGQKVASLVERAKSLESPEHPERPEEPDEGERPAPEVRPEQSIGA